MSTNELQSLEQLQSQSRTLRDRTELVWQGQTDHRAYVLHTGWAYSYKLLPDGKQQITNVFVPGDFIGLRSVLLRSSDHSSATINGAVISEIRPQSVFRVFQAQPRLAAAILWAISLDEAMMVEHLVGIGRRSAIERVAHLLLELGERLRVVGLATETGFDCPLTQDHLANALGLSVVHVNRVLRRMRERGLIAYRGRRVRIHDLVGLRRLAKFDDGYLDRAGWAGVVNPLERPSFPVRELSE